ncbi:MAG: PepSY-associated TM helix domain-containing protein [Pseudomonadota bacterium]
MKTVHTWCGLLLGGLIFAVFWMGTLSVFAHETDAWMKPELRVSYDPTVVSVDAYLDEIIAEYSGIGDTLTVQYPKRRDPVLRISFSDRSKRPHQIIVNPISGERITDTDSLAGKGFFYPFHYNLHISWKGIGVWIVGFAAISFLLMILSGLMIHRKIVADFFVFRRKKSLRRSTLDLHNVTALVALPFHIAMPFTGLLIFAAIYLQSAAEVQYKGDRLAAAKEMSGLVLRPPGGTSNDSRASIDGLVEDAMSRWSLKAGRTQKVDQARVFGFNDANGVVLIRQVFPSNDVELSAFASSYDLYSGELLYDQTRGPISSSYNWLSGLHYIQFDHWVLRWLYFLAGIASCVMIASGQLSWMRARIRKGNRKEEFVRAVRALTIGCVTGIIIASGAFLVANRLLPRDAAFAGYGRSDLEVWVFFIVWIVSFCHAAVRDTKAWRDQSGAIAFIAALAVLLNWVTTGDHLFKMIGEGLWPIAGMDLFLIASSVVAIASAVRLFKTERKLKPHKLETRALEHRAAK